MDQLIVCKMCSVGSPVCRFTSLRFGYHVYADSKSLFMLNLRVNIRKLCPKRITDLRNWNCAFVHLLCTRCLRQYENDHTSQSYPASISKIYVWSTSIEVSVLPVHHIPQPAKQIPNMEICQLVKQENTWNNQEPFDSTFDIINPNCAYRSLDGVLVNPVCVCRLCDSLTFNSSATLIAFRMFATMSIVFNNPFVLIVLP